MKGWPQSWRPEHFVDDFAGGRRQTPRCEARLKVSLRFVPSTPEAEANSTAHESSEIIGETRNLSETGLAVSVASNHIDDRYFNVVGSTLELILNLPAGTIQIRATPKWCQWSTDDKTPKSYLIGLRITEMSDEEWVLLVRYVHACL